MILKLDLNVEWVKLAKSMGMNSLWGSIRDTDNQARENLDVLKSKGQLQV